MAQLGWRLFVPPFPLLSALLGLPESAHHPLKGWIVLLLEHLKPAQPTIDRNTCISSLSSEGVVLQRLLLLIEASSTQVEVTGLLSRLLARQNYKRIRELKGRLQKPCKWLFRPNFFSSSKWAQFLHVTLDLTGKHWPLIFSAALFFVFKKFSWTSPGGKCVLHWFYCLEKQSFLWKGHRQEKNCVFAYVICGKWKRDHQTKIGGYVFLWSGRPHANIELIWRREKKSA